MKCPNCSAQVFEEDKFCGECGQDLTKMKPLAEDPEPVLNNVNQDSPVLLGVSRSVSRSW